jgi:hypothetical protein
MITVGPIIEWDAAGTSRIHAATDEPATVTVEVAQTQFFRTLCRPTKFTVRPSSARRNFSHGWVVDASRPASLLLGYIRQVCALVAPRRPGASAAEP